MQYLIWSEEHGAWWLPARTGYTRHLMNAGRYSEQEADEIVIDANEHLPAGIIFEVAFADPFEK